MAWTQQRGKLTATMSTRRGRGREGGGRGKEEVEEEG